MRSENVENSFEYDSKAVLFAQKGCELNDGYGCFLLGNFFWDGFGVETQDNWKAAELYEKACQLNNSSGCIELGRLYEHKKLHLFSRTEQVFSMDSEMAAKLYKKACTLGNDVGCSLANSVHD
ncbi:sel1 repeat family protein [Succinatimonas hippei]|uniref:tetratricopeptide repeat protein n=1 Tax=Succinatimonas hippei TaxID=626938 RepID=UPI0020114E8B|nr:tetratricopeptide repeat protein [Succinatimonas hippei]MCL1602459.1 sel1 repeat family protein [Succinatimonas hippei]